MTNATRIFLAAFIGCAFALSVQAQGITSLLSRSSELGAHFSAKNTGLTVLIPYDEDTMGEIRLVADLEGIISGRENVPGAKLSYLHDNVIHRWNPSSGLQVRLLFCPGVSVGIMRDRHLDMGLVIALTGDAGFDFVFNESPVTISFRFSGDAGCHLSDFNRDGCSMNLYKNGLYRLFYPELSIRYRF